MQWPFCCFLTVCLFFFTLYHRSIQMEIAEFWKAILRHPLRNIYQVSCQKKLRMLRELISCMCWTRLSLLTTFMEMYAQEKKETNLVLLFEIQHKECVLVVILAFTPSCSTYKTFMWVNSNILKGSAWNEINNFLLTSFFNYFPDCFTLQQSIC